MTAVGAGGVVLSFNGEWHVEEMGGGVDLEAVTECAGTLFAAGRGGWLARREPGGWVRIPAPTSELLAALACQDERILWVGGGHGALLTYDPTRPVLPSQRAR